MSRSSISDLLVFILAFSFAACSGDEVPDFKDTREYPGVKEEFWPHFTSFETEAAKRGRTDIDLLASGITGVFTLSIGPSVVGECQSHPAEPNAILIDSILWNKVTDLQKERIIYHELGHCTLGRGHDDSAYPFDPESPEDSNRCKSIMQSGLGICFMKYTADTRASYLDELFK